MARYRFGQRLDLTAQQKAEILARFSGEQDVWVRFALDAGVPALETLLESLGGNKIHVPMKESFWAGLLTRLRNEELRARFTGGNTEQLAMEYGISRRTVQRILMGPRRRSPLR